MPTDACELGAGTGLPGEGQGRLVLMVTPGDGDRQVLEPVSEDRWHISVRREGPTLTVISEDAPDGTLVWIRDPLGDQQVALSGGVARVRLQRSAEGGLG